LFFAPQSLRLPGAGTVHGGNLLPLLRRQFDTRQKYTPYLFVFICLLIIGTDIALTMTRTSLPQKD
jgi:hypothetical protein